MRNGVVYDRSWMEQRRNKMEMTQSAVALGAKTSVSNYNRVEKGFYGPDVKTALRICDVLRIDPRMFLNEKPLR